ncbi:MAG: hypothetical protein ACO1OQ_16340, partial [Rufibacter sp.]
GKTAGLVETAVRRRKTGPRGRERLADTMKQQRDFAPGQAVKPREQQTRHFNMAGGKAKGIAD